MLDTLLLQVKRDLSSELRSVNMIWTTCHQRHGGVAALSLALVLLLVVSVGGRPHHPGRKQLLPRPSVQDDQSQAARKAGNTIDSGQPSTIQIAVVLPSALRIDAPWLLQIQDAVRLALAESNGILAAKQAAWRLEMKVVGARNLSYPLTINASAEIPELFTAISNARSERILFDTLDALQAGRVAAFIAIESDEVVRTIAPLAGAVHIPLVTTNTNRELRTRGKTSPTLLRASGDDTWLYVAVKDVLLDLQWHHVALFYATNSDSAAGAAFSTAIERLSFADVLIEMVIHPTTNGTELSEETKTEMQYLKSTNISIMLVRVSHTMLPMIMEYAATLGMVGVQKNYVWVFADLFNTPSQYPKRMWRLFDGAIVIRPHFDRKRLQRFAKGLDGTLQQQQGTLHARCSTSGVSLHAAYAYDSVLSIAKALEIWQGIPSLLHSPQDQTPPAQQLATGHDPVNLTELQDGRQLTSLINAELENGTTVNFSQPEYDILVVDNQANLLPIGRWMQKNISLMGVRDGEVLKDSDIYGRTLHQAWGGRFPVDVHIREETARVLVYPYKPFIYRKPGRSVVKSLDDLDGVLVSVWRNITQWYNMTFSISIWPGSAKQNSLHQFLLEECLMHRSGREWDVILGGMAQRRKTNVACYLSQPIFQTSIRVTYERPKPSKLRLLEAFKPLGLDVWMALLITLVVGAAVLAIIDPKGLETARRGHIVPDAIFMAFTTFFGFPEHNSEAAFARIFILSFQFLVCVVVAMYTASSAQRLSESGMAHSSFKSANSPADFSGHKVGYVPGTDSGIFIENLLGATSKQLVPVSNFSNIREGLRRKQYDLFLSSGVLARTIAAEHCDVVHKPVKTFQQYGLIYHPDWPWRGVVNDGLKRHITRDWIQIAMNRHMQSSCPPVRVSSDRDQMELSGLAGLFIIGACLCFPLVAGKVFYLYKYRRQKIRDMSRSGVPPMLYLDGELYDPEFGVTWASAYEPWQGPCDSAPPAPQRQSTDEHNEVTVCDTQPPVTSVD